MVTKAFQWEKVETWDFSESFVVYKLKEGRYRQLIELMKLCKSYKIKT